MTNTKLKNTDSKTFMKDVSEHRQIKLITSSFSVEVKSYRNYQFVIKSRVYNQQRTKN